MFGGALYELPKEFMTELSSHIPDPCSKLFDNHWLCGQECQIMQPESEPKHRSLIFPSWDCSVMWHHPRAAMQGLVSFRGTTLYELMTTVTPQNVHKHWVEFSIQSLWTSVFVFSKCGIFRFFWFPTRVNCPVPRQCFLCVRDSLCPYLFMWGQFYTISDCGQEHQLLGSTEVCSTHLDLVWLLLCYFRLVNSLEALPDCLINVWVTLFLF